MHQAKCPTNRASAQAAAAAPHVHEKTVQKQQEFGGGKRNVRSVSAQQLPEADDRHADEAQQAPLGNAHAEHGPADLGAFGGAVQNKAGDYIAGGDETGVAALAAAQLAPDLRGWVEDPAGAEAYPIVTFTWMLFYKDQDDKKAAILRDLVRYCATDGQKIATSIGYIPLPQNVVDKVLAASQQIQ